MKCLVPWMLAAATLSAQQPAVPYLDLSKPVRILETPQAWEGDQQPHTLSVVELNRGGFKYWGYYALNHGRGTGLARSNDLVHWTKYEGNPLLTNARWTTALVGIDPKHPKRVYMAITRDYETTQSHIALYYTDDGVHLKESRILVPKGVAPINRNQNPNLFRDPVSKLLGLVYYRGNDENHFEVVLKQAARIEDLDKAPEAVLLRDTETVAAPSLLYVKPAKGQGIYYLSTEIYPGRYDNPPKGEWQVKVFASENLRGPYTPTAGNPVQGGERACLFQHIFKGRFYGFQSCLDTTTEKWFMEVIQAPLP